VNETRFGPPSEYRSPIAAHGGASPASARRKTYAPRNRLWVAGLLVLVALICFVVGFVRGQAEAQNHYLMSMDRAEGAFRATRKGCEAVQGSEWRPCIAKALSDKWRAMAQAEVSLRNTPEAYRIQRIVDADAALLTDIEECGAMSGSRRLVCDSIALDAFRAAMKRATGSESAASTECTLAGCPAPAAPETRAVRKRSRV
jgi:hypothetical protein